MNPKKLKICFIGWANSEHVKRWVKWFADMGHEVHLLSNVYEDIPGVHVHAFQAKTKAGVAEDRSVAVSLQEESHVVVECAREYEVAAVVTAKRGDISILCEQIIHLTISYPTDRTIPYRRRHKAIPLPHSIQS